MDQCQSNREFPAYRKISADQTLVICIFLINVAAHAVQSTWSYFTMEKFQWNERMVGYSLGFIGVLLTIVQAGLIRIIIPKLGIAKSIIIGLLLNAGSLIAMGLAPTSAWLYVASFFYVFAGIAGPAIQSSISNQTPANEQGQIQGGLTCVISLTAIIGPILMTSLFSFFKKKNASVYLPGAPFYLGGLLALFAVILVINYFSKRQTA